ncbi:hypothetical protein E2C01_049431 [Portunus trituberculatus]|uniref:Uncharacterized protein n=1 Tax=Portunus trituberculatus TaxID=210409 RepID=A0A5B7GDY1_PORTR|nr:hypothetical protein [Portunus trituberculatus]
MSGVDRTHQLICPAAVSHVVAAGKINTRAHATTCLAPTLDCGFSSGRRVSASARPGWGPEVNARHAGWHYRDALLSRRGACTALRYVKCSDVWARRLGYNCAAARREAVRRCGGAVRIV